MWGLGGGFRCSLPGVEGSRLGRLGRRGEDREGERGGELDVPSEVIMPMSTRSINDPPTSARPPSASTRSINYHQINANLSVSTTKTSNATNEDAEANEPVKQD